MSFSDLHLPFSDAHLPFSETQLLISEPQVPLYEVQAPTILPQNMIDKCEIISCPSEEHFFKVYVFLGTFTSSGILRNINQHNFSNNSVSRQLSCEQPENIQIILL